MSTIINTMEKVINSIHLENDHGYDSFNIKPILEPNDNNWKIMGYLFWKQSQAILILDSAKVNYWIRISSIKK